MTVVDWALYRDGSRADVATYTEGVQSARRDGGFVWIGLHEPDAKLLNKIAEEFVLPPLAVEDAVEAHQRPKLELYGDTLFAVFKTVRYVPHEAVTQTNEIVETGEVMVFVGDCFVVTVRHGEHGGLTQVRERLEGDPDLLSRGPSAVLYVVADQIVDRYLEVTDQLDYDVNQIEELTFANRRGREVGNVYQVKREIMELRRTVNPLAQPVRTLADNQPEIIDPKISVFFRDVDDHLTRVHEMVTGYDELLTSMLQASLAQLSVAQNEDIRRITSWAAIIAVPTAVTGIYGMNFDHMPELHWTFGYPLVLGLITTACVLLYRGFRRNGWL